ncbi:uncharacterized protein LOC62_05G006823 [Vanrija pseudolonga]|uniref:Uncharacterized protein n=1 Tax=Vanrija pseudolonga TaxID=143232 RepID=A0AAF1BNL6_9TREE|nr:hypothetical protein LOC62_05G006823 [Vanrija pseudolonga]
MKPRYGSPGVVVNWGKDDVLPDLEYRILYKILLALLPRSDISRLLIAPLPARAPRNVYALDIKGLPPSWFIDQFKLNRQPLRVIRDIVTTSGAHTVGRDLRAPMNVWFISLLEKKGLSTSFLDRGPRPGTNTLVVNLSHDGITNLLLDPIPWARVRLDSSVTELVVVFKAVKNRPSRRTSKALQSHMTSMGVRGADSPSTVFAGIARWLGLCMDGVRGITVVGVDDIDPYWFGLRQLPETALRHHLMAEILMHSWSKLKGDQALKEEKVEQLLRFRTLAEYRQEVGEIMFRMATVERGGAEPKAER